MFYVVFSPRGFSNELTIAVFATIAEARSFRSDIDNDVNQWTVSADSKTHKRVTREYRQHVAQYYGESVSPLTHYNDAQVSGDWHFYAS